MKRQSDFLDYVLDNEATGKREIYRDGRVIAVCGKTCLRAGSLKHFDAEGPWGSFPARLPQQVAA